MQKIIAWIVVILIIAWAIFAFTDKQKQDTAPLADSSSSNAENTALPSDNTPVANPATAKASISYTANGFSPSTITVKKGTEITFSNESGKDFWPASAMHPTHTIYPGSSITKCGTADASHIFDACAGIASGGSWSFVFNEVGSWKYHDHLDTSHFGTVVVTQ
ncbi:MAG: hypothetical protein HZC03_00520 [Candidatus Lloydbacteria bacterium]|nr:hypothetical protein [Candidatus Lloydbacteria bacterium]